MFVPNTKISIAEFTSYRLHEVQVKKSMLSYINTGTIKLPSRARVRKRTDKTYLKRIETANLFKEGDPVTVWLGYNGALKQEFKGFVNRVNKTIPCQVEIEGYSWLMRNRTNVKKVWKSSTVKEIMTEAVQGTGIKVVADDVPIINYWANNATAAQVLDDLIKKTQGALYAFFVSDDTLRIGLKFTAIKNTVKYKFGYNVIKDDQLKERVASAVKVDVQLGYKAPGGKRTKASTSNGVGTVKKKWVAIVEDKDTLKGMTEALHEKQTFDGYEGAFTTFLIPYCEPGDKAEISDPFFNRNGSYLLESVTTTLGRGGGRRSIGIGKKV